MASLNELLVIYGVALVVTVPWIWAVVVAVREASRKSTWISYALVAVVLVGGPLIGLVYLACRIGLRREPVPTEPSTTVVQIRSQ